MQVIEKPAASRWQERLLSGWVFPAALLLVQALVVAVVFQKQLFHAREFLFANAYDGIKNYFTLYSYLVQPAGQGLLKFNNMNYPYGDYIFYTDNTPAFALAVKLLARVLPGLEQHTFLLFHIFLVSGILFSTWLVYAILKSLISQPVLIGVFSLVLPWINPQLIRLEVGHFNLSFSAFLLFGVLTLLRIYQAYARGRLAWGWMGAFTGVLTLGTFVHIYYLILVLAFCGFFFLFWFLKGLRHRTRPQHLYILASGFFTLVPPLLLSFGLLRLADGYYHQRSKDPGLGYDWIEWKLNFSALHTSYWFNSVKFLVENNKGIPYESNAYLGAAFLFGLLALGIAWLVRKEAVKAQAWPQEPTQASSFLWLLGAAALASTAISFGDKYEILDYDYKFTNYLNVFYYLRTWVPTVSQFRCSARFSWIFFWFCNFLGAYLMQQFWRRKQPLVVALICGLLLLALADASSAWQFHFRDAKPNNLTNPQAQQQMRQLLQGQQLSGYQAILPIPFYHIGTELREITIDPDDRFAVQTMQLSLLTGLPLMAAKLARTPHSHGWQLLGLFADPTLPADVKSRLRPQPVLVLLDRSFYDGSNKFYENLDREPANEVYRTGLDFIERYHLTLLAKQGQFELYRWDVQDYL